MISSPGWAGRQWRTIAVVLGGAEQVGVDPERRQVGAAALRLLLVAHADPDVGVDRVGAGGGGARVVGQLRPVPLLELVAGRRRDDDLDPAELAGDRQRAGDVVAVADVGEPQAGEVAEALAQGQQVGERLAGMVERGQRVDHRHLGLLGQLGDGLVRAGADHDRVDVAREDPGGVADRLAAGELQLVAAQDDRRRRRARRRRPRRRSASGSRAFRRRGRCCGRRARRRRRRRGARLSARRPGRAACRARRRPSSSPVRKSRFKHADTKRRAVHRHQLEPLPRARFPARPGAPHLALAAAADRRSATRPTSRSTAT